VADEARYALFSNRPDPFVENQTALQTLLSVLRCPQCQDQDWELVTLPTGGAARCRRCGRSNTMQNGVLQVNVLDEHHEVRQERASVPSTEGVAALGGWGEKNYAPATDPASPLGQAYLSLPYSNGSYHFEEEGYFRNVSHFAPEFDFLLNYLPRSGILLDLGADGTWSTAQLSRRGLTCIALDITDHLTLAHLFQTASPPYALVNVDMHEQVFADEAFDVITAFNALHHSKRLEPLAQNIGRMLKPGGTLACIEPYVQNAVQEAAFGADQSAAGINENVHTVERWHSAFSAAGLVLDVFALSDAFVAVYRKPGGTERGDDTPLIPRERVRETFYQSRIRVAPAAATTPAGQPIIFDVTIESLGRAGWSSRGPLRVWLGYHIARVTPEGTQMVAFDNERTWLHAFVAPRHPLTLQVPVTIAEPGTYEVEFDLIYESITWFKDQGGRTATATVVVR
jgi:SAM-dependent methyltransferase